MPTHKLITSGGQGCIFEPAIPCDTKNRKKRNKRSQKRKRKTKKRKTISKVMFHETSAKREITMDDLVRQIPDHENWCLLWDTLCTTPPYQKIANVSELKKCLSKKHLKPRKNQRYLQLVGEYGGKTLYEYGHTLLTKNAYEDQTAFDSSLNALIKPLKNLANALVSLQEAGISHGDISVRNVVVKGGKGYLIDFGLAFRFQNISYIKQRTKFLFSLDKAYDAYPYDFLLYGVTPKQVKTEIKDLLSGDFREGHEDHRRFHELILGKRDATRDLVDYLKGPKSSLQTVVRSLDTYSLGILVPTILHDVADERGITFDTLQTRCKHTTEQNKKFFALCRRMTAYKNRPKPETVLKEL